MFMKDPVFIMTLFRNEISGSVYSYSLYHATLCLANMYITMQLTQWFQPQVRMLALDGSFAALVRG